MQRVSLTAGVVVVYAAALVLAVEGPDDTVRTSDEQQGVRFSVGIAPVKAGVPVPIQVELANNTKAAATISYDANRADQKIPIVKIDLVDKKGKSVPLTRYGKKHMEEQANGPVTHKSIDPEKKYDISVANLGLIYDLSVPGEYDATITCVVSLDEFSTPGSAHAKDVHLKVKTKITITDH